MEVPQTSCNMMKKTTVSRLPFLPQEILIEILAKLPVKSLVRFRCVSEFFYFLIGNLLFANMHRNWSLTLLGKASILIAIKHRTLLGAKSGAYYTINLSQENEGKLQARRVRYLDSETFLKGRLGSCDGLICLSTHDGDVTICNLSTRQYVSLPRMHPNSRTCCALLGFDSVLKRYKVLKLAQFFDDHTPHDAKYKHWVFTVGVDLSWREINCSPGLFYPISNYSSQCTSVHIKGVIYSYNSLIEDNNGICRFEIGAFKVESEKFSMIPFPDELSSELYYTSGEFIELVEVEGRLGLVVVREIGCLCYLDIWSWEKSVGRWEKIIIPIPLEESEVISKASRLSFTTNHAKEIVVFCADNDAFASMLGCNLKRQVWRKFDILGFKCSFEFASKVGMHNLVDNVFTVV